MNPYLDTTPQCQRLSLAPRKTAVEILDAVGARFGVTWDELLSKSRIAHIVAARHVASWLMRRSGMSYPAIGRALGGRDHTTAMAAVARVEAELRRAPEGLPSLEAMLEPGFVSRATRVPGEGTMLPDLP